MKPKTAFESGNSPPKVSENGAPIQTGRGLQLVLKEIREKFEAARKLPAGPLQPPQHVVGTAVDSGVYTPQHVERFQRRVQRLSTAALESSHAMKNPRQGAWIVEAPNQTPEELYKAALGDE